MVLRKVVTLSCALAFVIGAFQFISMEAEAGSNELAVLLPESDGVVVLDSKRLVFDALPQILSSNTPLLEKIDDEIDKLKTKSGLDLRKFDSVVVGLKSKVDSSAGTEFDAVLLARGLEPIGSLKDVAETASKGKYRSVKSGTRTIYVFSSKNLIKDKTHSAIEGSFVGKIFDKLFKGFSEEIAITAFDSNTVAFGSLERVKDAIGNTPRIDGKLLALLERKPNSLANMGMFVPTGLSQYLELEDDELGENLNSIRQVQGAFNVNDGTTTLSVAAKTIEATQAEELASTLQAIRGMFAGILKNNKSADKQVYGRMLENLEVTHAEKEIFVDLMVPKSDLDVIIGKK
jgi:hypothetical protein